MNYCVAIDFEAFGGITPKNGFTQIGAVIFDIDNDKIMSTFSMNAKQDLFEVEERCYNEFWSKHMDLFQKNKELCSKSEYDCYEVINQFWKWLYKNLPDTTNCYFIGDNTVFDYAILRMFSLDVDILYAFGSYREIIDVGLYYTAYAHYRMDTANSIDNASSSKCIKQILNIDEIPKFPIEHTHTAVDDAANIAYKWSWFNKNTHL